MAIVLVVLFGVAALVIDLGMARATKARAQVAADAAALAAAEHLSNDDPIDMALFAAASDRAMDLANENLATEPNWAGCIDDEALGVPSDAACVSFDNAENPSRVRVLVVPDSQPALFGALFGADEYTVAGVAEARIARASTTACDGPCTSLTSADLEDIDLGAASDEVLASFVPDPPPDPPAADPTPADLAGECPPPGVYLSVQLPGTECVLASGTYVILGELEVPAETSVTGEGVTVFLGCGDVADSLRRCLPGGENGGRVIGRLGSSMDLDGQTDFANGLALFTDPDNTARSHLIDTWRMTEHWIAVGERESPPRQQGLVK